MRKSIGLLFAFLLFATAAFAQLTSVSGTVTDPAGALIPGATISLMNVQTGAQRDTKADDQGHYQFLQIPPGMYRIVAKATGFNDETLDKIELLVNQPATIPIVFQKIGATQTTVTVEAAATQINTQDATLGNAITTQQITELPSFARNVANLLTFQPGVTMNGNVNGGKSDQGNITLDGADVNNQNNRTAMQSVLNVTLDSVEEFRTTTTNGGADVGRTSGAQITLVTKSGTNTLHGSMYEYRRGTETAANDFFNNLSGTPRAPLLINIFGGTIGGPIKKNKLFAFVNYEGRRDASAATQTRTVPTDSFRSGILQYKSTSGTTVQLTPADVAAKIDGAHIGEDAAILKVLQGYPKGNLSTLGDGLNLTGFLFNSPEHNVQNTYITRWDWNIDDAGKHRVFVRAQLQDFWSSGAEQFPGQAPASVSLNNSKGTAVGYTWLIKPNLIATTNWGFTRAGTETTGVLTSNYITFRGMSSPFPITTDTARIIPVNAINQDFAWTHGSHDVRFGGVMRFISNSSSSFGNNFSTGDINAPWLLGTGKDFQPSDLSSSFRTPFVNAGAIIMGLVTEGDLHVNYLADGTVLSNKTPVLRDFKNQEYEWYLQDTWRVTRNFTVTAGIRHSMMPAVYESNGQQTTAIPSLANSWMSQRLGLANLGLPQSLVPDVQFVLSRDEAHGGKGLYPDMMGNFAPRLAIAYSPKAESGIAKWLFGGPGKTSIRAGWGMFYDLIGQPLAQLYSSSALGFSTLLSNPANSYTSATAPRFTDNFAIPAGLLPAAPKGGFPQTQPNIFQITNSVDDALRAPYTLNTDFSIGREFGHGFFVQGSFVQRLSRRSLAQRDVAEPTNLVDPKSGQSYFQAMQILGPLVLGNNGNGVGVANVPKIPFFENLFPGLANPAKNLTASQGAYNTYLPSQGDMTTSLTIIDTPGCEPGCSIYGPYALFNAQYSALGAWSSVGHGNYNAMQWTVRKRMSAGLTFDLNYTYGKSEDLGSGGESQNSGFGTGFIQNVWFPNQMWAVSNYDARSIVNFFAVWQVPVGKGRHFLPNANRLVDGVIGGWEIAPTWQYSSPVPVSVNDGQNWATDWNLTTTATQIAAVATSPVGNVAKTTFNGTTMNSTGGPNLFANPATAASSFRFAIAGESGTRDELRIPGPWSINMALSKNFTLFTLHDQPHVLQLRGEVFNLTNSVVFNGVSLDLGTLSTFGKFTGDSAIGPRQMQFAMRYSF